MSIFKKHETIADRSASDRRRHKQKIEKAIKEGIHDIIAEESIIGKDGKKKIKIPVRGIKEYQFIFDQGNGSKGVGSAQGQDVQKGQVVRQPKQKGKGKGGKPDKPGNNKGEEYYDVEISLDELAHYLFDDLKLPDLAKKDSANVLSEKIKRKGYRSKGIHARLSKKETLKNKIRRKSQAIKNGTYDPDSGERFPFHEDDLKYKHIETVKKPVTNAVIFMIMDVSGSMGKTKKFLARSFFFLLYHFIRYKYQTLEIVFISHTTEADEVTEDDFFKKSSTGGTYISSGLSKAEEIIQERYSPSSWNIYTFHCSDGENWSEDNEKALDKMSNLIKISQLAGYIQIIPDQGTIWGQEMAEVFSPLESNKFKICKISQKEDIWPEFAKLFGGKYDVKY
jgi:sporulation protein YhbH